MSSCGRKARRIYPLTYPPQTCESTERSWVGGAVGALIYLSRRRSLCLIPSIPLPQRVINAQQGVISSRKHSWSAMRRQMSNTLLPARYRGAPFGRVPSKSSFRLILSYLDNYNGPLQRSRIKTHFVYIPAIRSPAPSLLHQLAYRESSALPGPDTDRNGWITFDPIMVQGRIFSTRAVELRATVRRSKRH